MANTKSSNTQKPQSVSFTRELRLLSSGQFKSVFDNTALKASNRHLLLLASHNQQNHARIGFVLAKKQLKLAVQRNRVKRIIRESFRHKHAALEALDIVILARSGLDRLSNQEIRELIDGLWQRFKPVQHHAKPRKSSK